MEQADLGLRDRKKVRVRATLAETAMRLFGERGFDQVTVDEIAAASDVSRRTFFRYFPTKEAVVFARREEQLAMFKEKLAAATDEPFAAIRSALLLLAEDYGARREQILAERALTQRAPSLVARDLEVDRAYESVIAEHLLAHSRRTVGDRRRAKMVAAAIVAVVRVVLEEWAERDGDVDLSRIGTEALELLEPMAPRFR